MKCSDVEQSIYLYADLSESERKQVDEHVPKCAECKELFGHVSSTQLIVRGAAGLKPQVVNHGKLTSNIIQAIQSESKQAGVFTKFFEGLFIRYAFVAASMILAILFFVEQQYEINIPGQPATGQAMQSKSATLNSSAILKDVIKKRETKKTERTSSLYACVKSGECANPLSKNLN